MFKNVDESLYDFIYANSESICPKGAYDKMISCSHSNLIRFVNPIIEENKLIKKAYADFTNQILKADPSQTIQGLQITIIASLKVKNS